MFASLLGAFEPMQISLKLKVKIVALLKLKTITRKTNYFKTTNLPSFGFVPVSNLRPTAQKTRTDPWLYVQPRVLSVSIKTFLTLFASIQRR